MSVISAVNTNLQLPAVRVVYTSNLAGSYYNGQTNNGVGATLTITATGPLSGDGVSVFEGDCVLLQNQTTAAQNGIWEVVSSGNSGSHPVLQRCGFFQCLEQMTPGQFVPIKTGTLNAGAIYVLVEPLPANLGTDAILFSASPLNSGLGTAAEKTASDDTKTYVASVSGATVVNDILVAADLLGTVKDGAAVTAAAGNLQAGYSGTAGVVSSLPSTASKGKLRLAAVSNTGNTNTDISNYAMGQASVISIPDPGQSTADFLISKVASDPGANLISFDITVGQASLASAGSVTLYASSGSKRYKIRSLQLNSGGTNFSGGGGDRLGQVTDNTTVYSVIPAASMQTLANAQWGATALPNPASAAINTSTAAGASLVFKYSGGTADYTAGSLVISGILERVA